MYNRSASEQEFLSEYMARYNCLIFKIISKYISNKFT